MNYHFMLLDKLLYSRGLPTPVVPPASAEPREEKGRRTEVQGTSPQEGWTTRKRVGGDGERRRPSLTMETPLPALAPTGSRKLDCWLSSSRMKGCRGISPNLHLFLQSCLMLMPSSGTEAPIVLPMQPRCALLEFCGERLMRPVSPQPRSPAAPQRLSRNGA